MEIRVLQNEGFNLFHTVDNGRVVLAAELAPDLREAVFGQALAQVHGDLSWDGYVP